ncbi:Alpha/Beta hydrolase protein [Aspergillus floccosus]
MFLSSALILASLGLVKALPQGDINTLRSSPLNWAPCNLDFPEEVQKNIVVPIDCATLEVPLDYTDSDSSKAITLQLVKVNATEEPVKGSVIFNPGGPGSSGVEEVVQKGPAYRDVFGGHFNVIGFDARGTGKTMPYACDASSSTANSGSLSRRGNATSLPQGDLWETLKSKAWHDGGVLVDACYKSQKDTGRSVNTAFVARDMLRIVDALNEDGLLRFWGRSYSTVLGQTFAAMFPDRVGRMLLDSNLPAEDYYSGYWLSATRGTDAALMNFFNECVNAGPSICPLANYSGPSTSPQVLMNALSEVFQELIDNPITLPDSYPVLSWWQPGGMDLLLEVKYAIFASLYRPVQFPGLFQIVQAALARNYTLWETANPLPSTPEWNEGTDALHGIACADATLRAESPEDMYSLVEAQAAQGSFADAFSPQLWPCSQWRFDAAERYEGGFRNINTSFPILFVNGLYDPITPLSTAWEISASFTGSRLVVHEGHGHGFMNHPSSCTIQAVREYFDDGKLPEHGTRCKPDKTAFEYLLELIGQAGNGTVTKRAWE